MSTDRTPTGTASTATPTTEAIAVIGLACRLPGAADPDAFWRLLRTGEHAVTETPAGRWDADELYHPDRDAPGKAVTRLGAYLDQVDGFDADFFGISPKEAVATDPQQRLMLELGWEALENARIAPDGIAGTRTGVFVGAIMDDYATLLQQYGGASGITRHSLTGTERGIIANRLSYLLGIHGPSLVVDSAQSSALVAVHLACESLRKGESTLAIAGGVNLNLIPESTVAVTKFGGLSPDGRCYTFDARANGYVRGEGGGAVVLKPLSRALADGDRVHCVIQGSAVNNDGTTPGLTVPSSRAQEQVIRLAYEHAGIGPETVQYVELHGTGTRIGDPLEARALGAALGSARAADRPLRVGSAKTNVGHLEGAAGIVGLIKTVLSIGHRELPASLNYESPNPDIPLDELRLAVQQELSDWPEPERRLVAGVSSFGMGGTNCHVVLAEAPVVEAAPPAVEVPGVVPWVLSGRGANALEGQAARLLTAVDGLSPADVGVSLVSSRAVFEDRAVVLGGSVALASLAEGVEAPGVVRGRAVAGGRVAVLFTGQGSQRARMGAELYATQPVFRAAFDEAADALDAFLPRALKDVVFADNDTDLDQTLYTQAALFAVETALFHLAKAHGVEPHVVGGHSIGEVTAAHVAGVLSLTDAARLVTARGRLMQAARADGAMIAVEATEDEVLPLLDGRDSEVSIAAVNGPASVVISGDTVLAEEVAAHFSALGRRTRRLSVSHAFHSPHMEGVLEEFTSEIAGLTFNAPTIPVLSNVTGTLATTEQLTSPAYWAAHIRGTVRFHQGVQHLHTDQGITAFLELGPDPVLTAMTRTTLAETDTIAVAALRKDKAEDETFLTALAHLWTTGTPITWNQTTTLAGGRTVDLPTYAFQRDRYWPDVTNRVKQPIPATFLPGDEEPTEAITPADSFASRLAQLPAAEREQALFELVRTNVAIVLGHVTSETVDGTRAFSALGFDSLGAVEFRNRLVSATGLSIPTTLTFAHPTPDAVAAYLLAEISGAQQPTAVEVATGPAAADEPLAIVGMACRYPGDVSSPEDLWKLVAEGSDAISTFPTNRGWDTDALYDPDPHRIGTSYTRHGGFLHDADLFDAEFFGISPREATASDPQQRLLLETTWEAFERAGIDPATVRGSRTGVFVGATSLDYGPPLHQAPEGLSGFLLTGSTTSIASGRIAYTFGLEGPAVTVDTACSSSLVALHLAAQSLRQGECTLAVAGGVTVMSSPGMFLEFSRQRGLSADGRCKAFSADADGTGWGEGVGVLLVERLSDAQRLGHPVLAVFRGSAVNQDGASNGLTAPNGLAQESMIRQALANARLTTADVDVVEAHGTGTRLGDPIEAQALLATYGQDRPADQPLRLGSIKSNIGHTQAAAGVAGIIKMVMAMRHGIMPRTLHADEASPYVEWESGAVELLSEAREWEDTGRPRRSAVSSFGISGTNAHVILEQAPVVEDVPAEVPPVPGVVPWILSGRGTNALEGQAARLLTAVDGLSSADVAVSLVSSRAVFEDRAVVLGGSAALAALAEGVEAPGVVRGRAVPGGRVAVLFTGQGSQRARMGAELYETQPVFRAAFDEAATALDAFLPRALKDVVFADNDTDLDQTLYTQAALFAVETALFHLTKAHGVEPQVVGGHSIGEVTAAHVAGVLSLADAARLVTARGRLMQAARADGAMIAVEATEDEVLPLLDGHQDTVSIAAVNGPTSVVISGDTVLAEEVAAHFSALGRRTRRLSVSHAFHSPHMEGVLEEFTSEIAGLTFNAPTIPVLSNVTGTLATTEQLTSPAYWAAHIRGTVRFHQGVQHLHTEQGITAFLELGPDPVLTAMTRTTLVETDTIAVAALRKDKAEDETFLTALAHLWTTGTPITWNQTTTLAGGRTVDLPTYAFQRERYWLDAPAVAGDASGLGLRVAGHELLGATVDLAGEGGAVFTGRLSLTAQPWLSGHTVLGSVLLPGTAFVDLAIAAGDHLGAGHLEDLTLHAPLTITGGVHLQITLTPDDNDGYTLAVHSRPENGNSGWTQHASGRLTAEVINPATAEGAWPPAGTERIDLDGLYERLADRGYAYGPLFQGLHTAWRHTDGDLFAEITLPQDDTDTTGFGLHPALLDAALHVLLADQTDDLVVLPFAWSGVTLHATGATALRVHWKSTGDNTYTLTATDPTGTPVVTIDALTLLPTTTTQLTTPTTNDLYQLTWTPTTKASALTITGDLVILGTETFGLDAPLHTELDTVPAHAHVVLTVEPSTTTDPAHTHDVLTRTLTTLQAWLAHPDHTDGHLTLVTRHAVTTHPADPAPDLTAAAIWGLARTAQTEHPHRITLLDLDDQPLTPDTLSNGHPQTAHRNNTPHTPHLTPATTDNGTSGTALDPDGTVLITGATGTLGTLFARHLVTAYGAKHLLLVSRRGADAPGAADLAAELTALGAQVAFAARDLADRDATADLLAGVPAEHPLTAVIHTAGVLADTLIEGLTPEQLADVLRPKVDAAWNLHKLTEGRDLSAFVLFSSITGIIGNAGQANYAAANTYLDALAHHRRSHHLPATSLAWGLWGTETGGMAGGLSEADLARWDRNGLPALTTQQGLELFDAALLSDRPVLVPARVNVPALEDLQAAGLLPDLYSRLVSNRPKRSVARAQRSTAGSGSTWELEMAGLGEAERLLRLSELVRSTAAVVLGYSETTGIDTSHAFKELGFDSLTGVEFRNRLKAVTGLRLPTTIAFDYPTPDAVAAYLLAEISGAQQPTAVEVATGPAAADEPLAIVGMACRYPGDVSSPEDLWKLVAEGSDAISLFPTNRGWDTDALYDPDPLRIGTSYTRHGGFLHDADLFDAEFFGISPREATASDPQQRLLLETAWEAFERAGIDPATVRGSRGGVFAGVMYNDYSSRLPKAPENFEGFLLTGNASSVISGRLAYTFGLEGPAVTVDTACSSSLVALHLAAQSLRQGECTLAVVGGVTVMSTPTTFVEFSRQRGLSADGRCKAFSADADGTGWGEGVGVLLVERLSDAQRLGHPVLAVVRGSAVNQDGASNGLTAPNGPSQERVIRQALANAGLSTADVDVVEAHGTGTRLGDPIEAQALLATYGQGRDADQPLRLGSIKSNIGHTQAAAGVAGIIKMVMAMRHGVLPQTLHANDASPYVEWDSGAVELLTEAREWADTGRPRRSAVSSFGISGTNAHVILEQAPVVEDVPAEVPPVPGVVPWILSGRGTNALEGQAARLLTTVDGLSSADVAVSLVSSRAVFEDRAVVLGGSAALAALAEGVEAPGVVRGRAVPGGRVAVLFTGQGSQRARMGAELYETQPVFRAAFDEAAAALDVFLPRALKDVVFAEGDADLDQTLYTQAALFAVETALFHLAKAHGVEPQVVGGHSIGEVTAAHVAGVLSLADAARLVTARGRLMQAARADGAMIAVEATEDEVLPLLDGRDSEVSIAAVNGPASVVISGDTVLAEEVAAHFSALGRRTRRLSVSHAFHSPHMEGVLEEFTSEIAALTFNAPTIPVLSNVTGTLATTEQLTSPAYWAAHIRGTVRFHQGVQHLHTDQGITAFLELGPDPVLTAMTRTTLAETDTIAVAVLRKDKAEDETFLTALAHLWTTGTPIAWEKVSTLAGGRTVELPTYAFQRERYWLDAPAVAGDASGLGQSITSHALLAAAVDLAGEGGAVFTGRLSHATHPWLAEHAVLGSVLLPGTAFVDLAIAAGDHLGAGHLEDLTLHAPLTIGEGEGVHLQITLTPDDNDGYTLVVHSRPENGEGVWTRHASGRLTSDITEPSIAAAVWPPASAERIDLDGLYERLADRGYAYGPLFQGLHTAWRQDGDLFAEITLPQDDTDGFGLHPALLDAALHTLLVEQSEDRVVLPFAWSGVSLHATGATALRVHWKSTGENTYALTATDPADTPVIGVEALTVRELSPDQLAISTPTANDLYQLTWTPTAKATESTLAGDPVVLGTETFGLDAPVHTELDTVPAHAHVLLTIEPSTTTDPAHTHHVLTRTLTTLQAWLAHPDHTDGHLTIVTRHAVTTGPGDPAPDLTAAAIWGLARTAQTEHPHRISLLDLDDQPLAADTLGSGHDQTAHRNNTPHTPHLTPTTGDSTTTVLNPDGTVLITGATGTLGTLFARHLVTAYGAKHLLLVSRRGADAPGAADLAAELTALGADITLAACDTADREAVERLLDTVPAEHPLTAVIHTAGVLADTLLTGLTPERLADVLRPKVDAAWNLHHLTQHLDLSAFVLFSSITGIIGNAGQANYAAANTYLDALAHHRHTHHLPATSLAWGLWGGDTSGMADELSTADLARIARSGIAPLTTHQGLHLFDTALTTNHPTLAPVHLDLSAIDDNASPVLHGLAPARRRRPSAGAAAAGGTRAARTGAGGTPLTARLAGLGEEEQRRIVFDLVGQCVGTVLGHSNVGGLDLDRGFLDMGFDSLTAVELRNLLISTTGLRLGATLVFDHPTPAALASYLLAQAVPDPADALLAELDRFEAAFAQKQSADEVRAGLSVRLQALLASLNGTGGGDGVLDQIGSASDDEIFAFIDNELGAG
ncbi:SDR family NAD(P)-dependent oxidoreductase [Kitasatospora sp. NPDC056184]|uniref:SDR family NAD(P)-dependent oxidoreductase n=1 Tax=Kitasatospora sp. NPDC056184 TaxID=3345738 RepID=UPI0035E2A07E